MQEEVVELGLHAIVALGYSVAILVTAGFGLLFEYKSYIFLSSGETMMALWIGGLGIVLLLFAIRLFSDKLLVVLRETYVELPS